MSPSSDCEEFRLSTTYRWGHGAEYVRQTNKFQCNGQAFAQNEDNHFVSPGLSHPAPVARGSG